MQIKIDTRADALYITLKKGKIAKTENKGDYLVDYDDNNELVGFEVLNFSKRVPVGERDLVSVIDNRQSSLAAQ